MLDCADCHATHACPGGGQPMLSQPRRCLSYHACPASLINPTRQLCDVLPDLMTPPRRTCLRSGTSAAASGCWQLLASAGIAAAWASGCWRCSRKPPSWYAEALRWHPRRDGQCALRWHQTSANVVPELERRLGMSTQAPCPLPLVAAADTAARHNHLLHRISILLSLSGPQGEPIDSVCLGFG